MCKKKKKSEASLQSNWSIFLCSVNLHNWGNSQQTLKCHKNQTLAILLPLWKKTDFPSTIFIHHRHSTSSAGKTIEKINLIFHICIMFYIGPSVVTASFFLLFFFICFTVMMKKDKLWNYQHACSLKEDEKTKRRNRHWPPTTV